MSHITVRYPQMRNDLIRYLSELSSLEYQKKNWLEGSEARKSQFDYSVHFFFDDTQLAEAPEKCIGWFLLNNEEVRLITLVIQAIENLFEQYGLGLTDAEYISKPEWFYILDTASHAFNYIHKS